MKTTGVGLLVALFLAVLPFANTNQIFYGPINAKFFLVVLVVNVLAVIAALHIYKRKETVEYKGRWFFMALCLTVAAQIYAALSGVFPERSFWSDLYWSSGVIYLLHTGLLAWSLSELLNERDWSIVRRAVIYSAGVFSFVLLMGGRGIGFSGDFLGVGLEETGLTFGNETYAGLYLVLAFIIGLIEFFRTKGWQPARLAILGSLILTAISPLLFNFAVLAGRTSLASVFEQPALMLGLARASSATLFLVLGFVAGCFLLRRLMPVRYAVRAVYAWGVLIILAITIGISLLFTPGSAVQQAYIQESSAARIIVWDVSTAAFLERPIVGWGPENFGHALDRHFDTRLFLDENFGEIWFERAHNVFLDTLVGSGVIGLTAFVLLSIGYLIVVYRARRKELITDTEALLLAVLLFAHILQLQTGFDTVGSYALLGVIGGYILWLERKMAPLSSVKNSRTRKIVAGGLLALCCASFLLVVLGEYARQVSLAGIFQGRTLEAQNQAMQKGLERISSFESLRLSSSSFIKGVFLMVAENPNKEERKKMLGVAHAYESRYQTYLEIQPGHYRALVNYAYLLLTMTVLGEDRTQDAKAVLARAYQVSPGHPLTYVLDALTELYRGNLTETNRLIDEALTISPDVTFTKEAKIYFDRQSELFPNITVLKLTNL